MKDFKIVGMAIALTCVLPCFGDGKDDVCALYSS